MSGEIVEIPAVGCPACGGEIVGYKESSIRRDDDWPRQHGQVARHSICGTLLVIVPDGLRVATEEEIRKDEEKTGTKYLRLGGQRIE